MSKRVLVVQDPLHPSCVIATAWTVHLFQAISEVVLSQQTTLSISAVMRLWRICENSKGIQSDFNLKRRVFVYGANGIQDQIVDEQEKVQGWISGMTDELNRLRRIQPAWIHQLQAQGSQQPPVSMFNIF